MIWRVLDQAIDWFVLRGGVYELLSIGADGIIRSEVIPGLWLDVQAMIRRDMVAVSRALQQGLGSPEHTAFVQQLAQASSARSREPAQRDHLHVNSPRIASTPTHVSIQ